MAYNEAPSYLPLTGGTLTGDLTLNGNPSTPNQAANKAYVDAISGGFDFTNSCYAGSTVSLTATYANGAAGIGATLTNSGTQAAFSIDGVSPAINSRILIKNQSSTFQNGIYDLTVVGSGATNWVLTRSSDYDTSVEIQPGNIVAVDFGTSNAGTTWLQTATVTIVGTDPILFSQFSYGPSTFLQVLNNLSDLNNVTTARTNLGLTNVAIQNVTNHSVLAGAASNAITSIAPSATAGIPLISQGTGVDPSFGVAKVAGGGTGLATLTAHALQVGNGTVNVTQVGPSATSGSILLSAGSSADPAFIVPTAGNGLSVTTNATTLSYALTAPVSVANGGTGATTLSNHGLLLGQGTSPVVALGNATNGQIPVGSTGADPVLATLTAGSNISITNGAGTITIAATIPTSLTWNNVTGTSQSIAINNGYLSNNAGTVAFSLPATATLGNIIRIAGVQGSWTLSQASGQQIKFGSSSTTVGSGGSLASTNAGDCIECIATNTSASTIWRVISSVGNITVV